jgi:hypothetical protein
VQLLAPFKDTSNILWSLEVILEYPNWLINDTPLSYVAIAIHNETGISVIFKAITPIMKMFECRTLDPATMKS